MKRQEKQYYRRPCGCWAQYSKIGHHPIREHLCYAHYELKKLAEALRNPQKWAAFDELLEEGYSGLYDFNREFKV